MKSYTNLAIVGAVATEDVFAGKKQKKENNQALLLANVCLNGKLPLNLFCSNSGSQIQGDENAVSTATY